MSTLLSRGAARPPGDILRTVNRWPLAPLLRSGLDAVLPLVLVALTLVPAAAQLDVTVDPAMTRGPANAPVTIVEFFDFE